jgi:hypothetical protein
MKRLLMGVFVAAAALAGLSMNEAKARFSPQAVQAPALVEQAACVTRRIRTVRPNGRVVYRTVRRCGPGIGRPGRWERCRTIRERVIRPNGRVVYRTIRRCR